MRYKCRLPGPCPLAAAGKTFSLPISSGVSADERCGSTRCSVARPTGARLRPARVIAPGRRLRQGRQGRPDTATGGSHRADRRAARRAGQHGVRRANAKFAGGQHRRARVRFSRQARVRRRLRGKGRPGPVSDGPEAFPGAGGRRRRRAAAQPGCQRRCEVQPRAHQAARAAERAVAEGPGRCAGAIRAVRCRRRPIEGAARIGPARPLLHDDRLAGRRRQQLRRGRRRHLRQSAEQPADDRLRADADVDQLQRLRERDGADPRPGAAVGS